MSEEPIFDKLRGGEANCGRIEMVERYLASKHVIYDRHNISCLKLVGVDIIIIIIINLVTLKLW